MGPLTSKGTPQASMQCSMSGANRVDPWTAVTFVTPVASSGDPTGTDKGTSVTPTVSQVIWVKSGRGFTTDAPTTVSAPPSSTQADALFELTPRASNQPTTPGLCRVLALRCERQFRIRLCHLYEECLLSGALPTDCFRALTSVIVSDERCNRL